METHTLSSDRLSVVLSAPGALYTGPRFDWTTQVRQVTLDGHTFLTREKEGLLDPSAQGWGLAGEFGIETAVGFDDCPEGGLFPKIGVGRLRKPDGGVYRFNRVYEVIPARFAVRPEGPGALQVTADQAADRGYGWFLKRHWSVRGTTLALTTTLANTGMHPLITEEYIHNFFGFDDLPVDGQWRLTLPRTLMPNNLKALVDPESLLAFGDSALTWSKTPTEDFFLSDAGSPVPETWKLEGPGLSVTETTDFPPLRFNLWGRGHVVSPELYRRVEVAPGTTQAWTRRWSFLSL